MAERSWTGRLRGSAPSWLAAAVALEIGGLASAPDHPILWLGLLTAALVCYLRFRDLGVARGRSRWRMLLRVVAIFLATIVVFHVVRTALG